MALFGSKKKGDAPDAPASSAPGSPVAAPVRATVVKEKTRPTKGAVKNGVITGLNIGNAAIKAVEVTAKNGQLSVTRLATVPTPPDAYQNGNVLSVTSLSNAVKALWKSGGFKGKAVISSVAGTGALVVRVIEVPQMTDAQLADAMRADAQLYIPFPPTEVQMDFKALRELPSDPDAGTMDVLLAAAQSEIIDLHIKTLQAARLDPRAVDVEPIAAGRTLALQKRAESGGAAPDYNEISAIANIGAFGTEISLLRGDVLVFTRSISAGGNSISQTIADALGVPLAEGERLKVEQGDALPPEGYSGAGTGDDFGFGNEFGGQNTGFGGEFDDFGLGTAPAATSNPNATTVLDAPAQTSSDPFDLDFFDQGPKSEPGAGHGQKEGEPPAGAPAGSFSFDDLMLPQSAQPQPEAGATPVAPASAKTPTFNFDFDLPSQDLPTTQDAVAPASTARAPLPGEIQVPGNLLPPPTQVASPGVPMASAFDFSDFDLPSVDAVASANAPVTASLPPSVPPAVALSKPLEEQAAAAQAQAPVAAPASSFSGFSFDEPAEVLPTTSAVVETGIAAPDAASSPAPDEGFDLNTAFGTEQPETAPVTAPAVSLSKPLLEPGTVTHVATVSASSPGTASVSPVTEGIAAQGLDMGGGFDFGDASDDIGDFGVGLSGGQGLDGSSIYQAMSPALEELSNEIARSLSFYLERVPDAALSRIYLTGGGALLKNLDVYLTGRLGAPTSLFNPLQLLPVSAPASPLTTQGPLYTVALGLALRDFVD